MFSKASMLVIREREDGARPIGQLTDMIIGALKITMLTFDT